MDVLRLGDITVEVELKPIKNVHLSVYPPYGKVRIAAPSHMAIDTIRIYAISKLSWIKKQRARLRNAERESARDFVSKESHYFLGKRYLMRLVTQDSSPKVEVKHNRLELTVRPRTTVEKRKKILDNWYRQKLKELVPTIVKRYERLMKVQVDEFSIRKMKTKWGTCNIEKKRIWLNLELAKKPASCIEYIVVHEMVHLLERRHNDRFAAYMDKYLPNWKLVKQELNRLPVGHVDWGY